MYSNTAANGNGDIVIDKKSIRYDRKNHILSAWTVFQTKIEKEFDILKLFFRFNIKNNTKNIKQAVLFKCNGTLIFKESRDNWSQVIPGASEELVLDDLKEYLKIK